jgi:hypothetical protein
VHGLRKSFLPFPLVPDPANHLPITGGPRHRHDTASVLQIVNHIDPLYADSDSILTCNHLVAMRVLVVSTVLNGTSTRRVLVEFNHDPSTTSYLLLRDRFGIDFCEIHRLTKSLAMESSFAKYSLSFIL